MFGPKLSHSRIKYYKGIWSRWKSLIVLFAILLIIALLLKIFVYQFSCSDNKNLYISLIGSLFFFGIGLFTAILGSKLPQEENFEIRVNALANGTHANKEAERFLRQAVESLMTYNNHYLLTITIIKTDRKKRFMYINVDAEVTVVNMADDTGIKLDVVGFAETKLKVEGSYGQVNNHYVTIVNNDPTSKQGEKLIHFIKNGQPVNLNDAENHRYYKQRQIDIDKNGQAHFKMTYEIWAPLYGNAKDLDDWFFNKFSSFTQDFNLKVVNNLKDMDIYYDYRFKDRNVNIDNPEERADGGKIGCLSEKFLFSNLKFQKDDKFEMFFKTQMEVNNV